MKIPRGLTKEICKKIPRSTFYLQVKNKRKAFGNMITEKQAACLVAYKHGIDVAKYLDESELRELRELASKENLMLKIPGRVVTEEKPKPPTTRKKELIKEISPYDLDLVKYDLDEELLHDCGKLVNLKQKRPAIREALLTLETRIREVLGLGEEVIGKELIDKAKEKDIFKRNVKSEEEGLYFLYRGAIQWLRNPPGHKKVEYSKEETVKIILFVDYLIKLFEKLVGKNP